MAHIRNRFVVPLIEKAKSMSPLIGLLGHRQVGKTTVLESLCDFYCTLDQKPLLELAMKDPEEFLRKNSQAFQGIDECQLAPNLFPALKEFVRKHKSPGQFLLSGSVRFTSRQAIRESLTGRIVNFDLLPFSISEMAHKELPNSIPKIMSSVSLERVAQALESNKNRIPGLMKEYQYYFTHGGLPGVCFIRDERLRNLRIREQLLTILDRDIRIIYPTNLPYSQILEFLRYIAKTQGQKFSYADAKRASSVSPVTQKKLLYALEAVFLIRRIPLEGSTLGHIFYLEDQAEAKFLLEDDITSADEFEHLIYRNVRAQLYYRLGHSFREFHFLTRGGSRIPYAIDSGGHKLGILPIANETPDRSELAAAASFLKRYGNSRVLYLHTGKTLAVVDERSLSAPVYYFI